MTLKSLTRRKLNWFPFCASPRTSCYNMPLHKRTPGISPAATEVQCRAGTTTMRRFAALTSQVLPMGAYRKCSTTPVAAPSVAAQFESMISQCGVEEALSDELILTRSASTKALHIQLNKPKKLNVLSYHQVHYLSQLYSKIHQLSEETCSAVVLTGAGDKAFCAGWQRCECCNQFDRWRHQVFDNSGLSHLVLRRLFCKRVLHGFMDKIAQQAICIHLGWYCIW